MAVQGSSSQRDERSGFSHTIRRMLKLRETDTAHKTWAKLNEKEKSAMLSNCGAGMGSTRTEPFQEEESWTTN